MPFPSPVSGAVDEAPVPREVVAVPVPREVVAVPVPREVVVVRSPRAVVASVCVVVAATVVDATRSGALSPPQPATISAAATPTGATSRRRVLFHDGLDEIAISPAA